MAGSYSSPRGAPRGFLTTEEVVEQTGVSKVTLYHYRKRGLVGEPYVHTDPAGHGRRAYWHPSVVETVGQLRALGGRGVALESVVKRQALTSMANSSISSDTAHEIAKRWWLLGSAGDLAGVFGLDPKLSHRALVLSEIVERLATGAGLRDDVARAMGTCVNVSLRTVIHNFISGIETVVAWNGVKATVAPTVALDAFHRGAHTGALAQFLSGETPATVPVTSGSFNSHVLVSVEVTSALRDLWKHYGETLTDGDFTEDDIRPDSGLAVYWHQGHSRFFTLPAFSLSRGFSVRDYAGIEKDESSHVEYDYMLMPSGFGDGGLTLVIDTATARLADQGPAARFTREEHRREATQRDPSTLTRPARQRSGSRRGK